MKKPLILLAALSICLALTTSCGKEKEREIQDLHEQVQIEKEKTEQAQQMVEKAKIDAEIAQQEAQKSKSTLFLLIGLSITAAVIAVIIGIAMGSKARRDATVRQIAERRDADG